MLATGILRIGSLMTLLQSFRLLLLVFIAQFRPVWADHPLEIITLKSRPVNEVISLVQPFLGPGGVVTGMNNQLIVRAAPERLQEIRKILEQIDKPPRRLVIHVTQDRFRQQTRDRVSAGARVNIGDSGKIDVGRPVSRKDRLEATIRRSRTRSDLDSNQRVQTIEGRPAFIATGTVVPIPIEQGVIAGGVVHYGRGLDYRNAVTGFYVLPRVNGDLVTLEISTHLDQPSGESLGYDLQRVSSTLSGKIGEWIDIGGIDTQGQMARTGILLRGNTTERDHRRLLLLVEEVP